MAASVIDADQTRSFQLQVYRAGLWIDVPVTSARGTLRKAMGGQLVVNLPDAPLDQHRSRLYDGEKVRAYRGLIGAPQVRCWTGFVDSPTANDVTGITRDINITDNFKELTDAILLTGVVYDTFTPGAAAADAIQQAINTGQFLPTNDAGVLLSSTASYNVPTGNGVCYFPDIFNSNGTLFQLASGQLGSFTVGNNQIASFQVPGIASGQPAPSYLAFELQQRYLIASTMTMYGFGIASTSTSLPPPQGSTIVDFNNGIFYFNPLDASTTASFSAHYYSAPLWAFAPGAKVADVLSQIFDLNGARWNVDANGKVYAKYIDTTTAPKRVLSRGQYQNLSIQNNRDRRNIIICEGWDGNCGRIATSKCVLADDINNPPPVGLGKRAYIIIQDPSWKTREAINNACYYAAQQIGRRGKIISTQIIDDPSLALEDVIAFSGAIPEITDGDFFYVESVDWQYATQKGGGLTATSQVTATGLPGQGTVYLGAVTNVTPNGEFDFTTDVQPMSNGTLIPNGGSYWSTFTKGGGLQLQYFAAENGFEAIDIFGSDGSHLGPYQASRTVGTQNVILPVGSMSVGVLYVIKLRYEDANGQLGIYRSFSKCAG